VAHAIGGAADTPHGEALLAGGVAVKHPGPVGRSLGWIDKKMDMGRSWGETGILPKPGIAQEFLINGEGKGLG